MAAGFFLQHPNSASGSGKVPPGRAAAQTDDASHDSGIQNKHLLRLRPGAGAFAGNLFANAVMA